MPAEIPPDPLAGLHDVVLPAPAQWLPPHGPAWLVLGMLLVVSVAWSGHRIWRRHRRNRYRREALAELERLFADPVRPVTFPQVSELLKRTALGVFPREQVAPLHGVEWCEFLCRTGSPAFADSRCIALCTAAYQRESVLDVGQRALLRGAARQWVLAHRAPSQEPSR